MVNKTGIPIALEGLKLIIPLAVLTVVFFFIAMDHCGVCLVGAYFVCPVLFP